MARALDATQGFTSLCEPKALLEQNVSLNAVRDKSQSNQGLQVVRTAAGVQARGENHVQLVAAVTVWTSPAHGARSVQTGQCVALVGSSNNVCSLGRREVFVCGTATVRGKYEDYEHWPEPVTGCRAVSG